jgi:hypothetical protein
MSPLQLATIWSMAASFDLEIIENPPIERRNKSLAPALFLWIMWIGPGDQPRWARVRHLACSAKAETGFPKTLCSNKEETLRRGLMRAGDHGFRHLQVPAVQS